MSITKILLYNVSMNLLCDRHKCYFCSVVEPEFVPVNKNFRRLVEVHHLKEKNEGGDNSPENLIPACSSCHSKIHMGLITIGKWYNYGNCYKLHWTEGGKEHYGSFY